MCNRYLLFAAILLLFVSALIAAVPTTLDDFTLPGSQPLQSGDIRTSTNCDCHANYAPAVEPSFNWKGSMMAQAARDVLYWATVAIANQDAPSSGDLCIRCHTPRGWLGGRSTPTDGSALVQDDRDGVNCHYCHKAIKPTPPGVNPYPGNTYYTANTYPADQTYLSSLATIPTHVANGMYVVSDQDVRRGPYIDETAPHQVHYSPLHLEASICGTCHDVSNPAFSKTPAGDYEPNTFGAPAPDFSPYTMFPVERTFSEWKMSAYNTTAGVYAPQFGGNKDTVRTCQDCHMRDVTGRGCNKGSAPIRTDLGLHDMTGGNTFIPLTIAAAFPADPVDQVALDSGVVRARRMLKLATSMTVAAVPQGGSYLATVRVTNETGHKLPSGYPEGRRIWLNVKAYSQTNTLLYESGAYNNTTAVLTHDADIKVYEIHPGISQSLAPIVGLPAGPSFHFVLNDTIYLDNRIPPRGFTNANFASIQSPAVGYTYPDGQYWDETEYLIPGATARLEVALYYQTTSKEMVEFLRDENHTNTDGTRLYNLWTTYGKSAPVVMNADTLPLTPLGGNNVPVLATIGPKVVDENNNLNFLVSANDADGTTPTFTTSSLPDGATFTDNVNGTGTFNWTPTYSQAGVYPVTFRASDGIAVDSEIVTITVDNINRAPELASIGPKTVDEGSLLNFVVSATDADDPSTLSITTSSLPLGAIFTDSGNGTGTFNWTPAYSLAGSYPITFRVSDGIATDSEIVVITVENVNRPPSMDSLDNRIVTAGSLLQIDIYGSDADGDSVTFRASNLPGGASLIDLGWDETSTAYHGRISWTPTEEQIGVYSNIRVVVTDLVDSVWTTISIEVTGSACCINVTGNVDCSPDDGVDVGDLTALINNLFLTFTPLCCEAEANCDGDGGVDVGDLTALIDNLFITFTPLAPCQ